jgi:CubicO group peptidase (beta-lactamase class C family)
MEAKGRQQASSRSMVMQKKILVAAIISALVIPLSACGSVSPSLHSGTELNATTMSTSRPMSTTFALSPSARMGAVLTGSGAVKRRLLTYDDLMTGSASGPVDDSAFALPEDAAQPVIDFEGRLQIPASTNSGSEVIRDDFHFAANPGRLQLPALDIQFVHDGSYLIPVRQGLVFSDNPNWNYIIGPGRIWLENDDHGYARASLPFALVERNQNCTHNGVMTFLFNGSSLSKVRYQITQETCLTFKFNLWGQADATFTPQHIPEAATLTAAHAAEVANRLPTRPVAALSNDYPDGNVDLSAFTRGITREHLTAYGLVIGGINYVSDCRTRYGEYAYCESMRLPSYSTAKSAFAAIALLRLGQKYGTAVYRLLIKDYVPEAASAAGDWSKVTFGDALDMSTGNYAESGFEVDEAGPIMTAFLDQSESYADKIQQAFRFPNQMPPGRIWVYHTSDTFIVTRAMNNYLVQQEGQGADIFNFVRDEVYLPLHLSAGALSTLRTDNNPGGLPFGGYGLFWTQDDIAKIALLLNDRQGKIDGRQVLEPGLLAASMQRDPHDRGLNTTGMPVYKYRNGLWAREWTPSENQMVDCTFWTPFMSGYGGISVVLIPNGSNYYYFSDNNEFTWYEAVNAANQLKPICPK